MLWLSFSLVLMVFGLWISGLALAGALPFSRPPRAPGARLRLRVFVAAHNEERVIADVVRSVRQCDYPQHLVDVVVIADRCTDRTGEVAAAAGARVVFRESGPAGKSAVLRHGFSVVGFDDVDGVVVLDADNAVSAGFLAAVSEALASGRDYCQAYIRPAGRRNWVSRGYWLMSAYMHLLQRGRALAGLPVMIGGTGFAVRSDALRDVPMDTCSLVEDFEYAWMLTAAGRRGAYLSAVWTDDEKPTSLRVSWRQRLRWARGGWQAIVRILPQWRRLSLPARVDLLSFVAMPLFSVPLAVGLARFGVPYLLEYWRETIVTGALVVLAARLPLRALLDGLWFPVISLTQVPVVIWSMLTWRNLEWKRTPHVGRG